MKILLPIFMLIILSAKQSYSCPENSVSCDPQNYNGESSESFEINGMIEGEIIETDDKIIINGAKIILNNDSESAINVGNYKKELFINNTEIISNDFKQENDSGYSASIVTINNENDSATNINDLHVTSNNGVIKIHSSEDEVCSALVCLNDISDDDSSVYVEASGNHKIEANRN